MVDFKIFLDDLGLETVPASFVYSQVLVFDGPKHRKLGAVRVVPVSVESTTSGTLKGAAWGLFLAGPVGAAVGAMVGGGPKVAFELHTLEGEVLPCLASKGAYLKIKKYVDAKPAKPRKLKAGKERTSLEMRSPGKIGPVLIIGMILIPFITVWFFFTKGFTSVARVLAVVWTVFWIVGLSQMDSTDGVETPSAAPASEVSTAPQS